MNHFRSSRSKQPVDGFMNVPLRRVGGEMRTDSQPLNELRFKGRIARQPDNFTRAEGYHPTNPAATFDTIPKSAKLQARQNANQSMLNMSLPAAFGEEKRSYKKPKRRVLRSLRIWALRSVVALVIICIIAGGFLFTKGYFKLHTVFQGNKKAVAALVADVNPNLLNGEGDGRINILLLGIGGDGHEGPDLTDTILLASIDPVNDKMSLLSIPRDLWVAIPGHGSMKINAAYETGKYAYLHSESDSNANPKAIQAGFNSANQVVSQVLGISIDYNILVNFKAFQQAVNTVGGVTVNVPTALYDPTMAWENGGNPILAKAGVQTFNGAQALMYVRSRETTSDFARTQRQRAVLVALGQKASSLGTLSNPLKISQLIDAFGDNVVTNLSLSNMARLYSIAKAITPDNIASLGLADAPNNYVTTGRIGTQSVVEPTAGLNNYTAIQNYVHEKLVDGYITKENASITVLNGTTNAALGANKAAVLKSYGYNVGAVGTAPTTDYGRTVIVDFTKGKDKYTAHYLAQRFGVSVTTKLPDSKIQPGTANFVVILGRDQL